MYDPNFSVYTKMKQEKLNIALNIIAIWSELVSSTWPCRIRKKPPRAFVEKSVHGIPFLANWFGISKVCAELEIQYMFNIPKID